MSARVSPYWVELADSGVPMAFPPDYDYDTVVACAKASVEHQIADEDQIVFRTEANGESTKLAIVHLDGSVEEGLNA